MGAPVQGYDVADLGADLAYTYEDGYADASLLSMDPGLGYFVAYDVDGDVELSFTGVPEVDNIEIELPATDDDFHLVANPYTSAIATVTFVGTNDVALVSNAVYFWDDGGMNDGASRAGGFVTYVPGVGATGVGGLKGTGPASSGYIGTAQGFFVEASDNIMFTNGMQTTGEMEVANSDDNFYRKVSQEIKKLKLSLSGAGLYNDIIVGLAEDATLGRDKAYDAKKFGASDEMSFYSLINDDKFAIQAVPTLSNDPIKVDLGFDLAEAGTYKLAVEQFEGFADNMEVVLTDNVTGTSYVLTSGAEINFSTGAASFDTRFSVAFRFVDVLSVDNLSSDLKVFGGADQLTINFASDRSEVVNIYALDGRLAFSEVVAFENDRAVISASLNRNQVYVLRVNDEAIKFVIQ